jgi:hypothetical protein
MRKCGHAVDVFGQRIRIETRRDQIGSVGRTVAGRDNCNVIPRSRPPVLASIAEKRRRVRRRRRHSQIVGRIFVIERQFLKREIVRMDVIARLDRRFRASNRLPITNQRLARSNRFQRDLVTGRDGRAGTNFQAADPQRRRGAHRHARDRHIV